ncbi:hypothetical protein HL653_20975 [Sphingomonas sp. AP4-R1]|uniref:hypothetical protein n=1 Tax=Sphingomonas sp. AP4-R1 TaxID=2735134 RepID=UPI0014935289|nr:hypothetical protein [Sphingomonas sp. AP4-R1]QJU59886.1 hypothetical protein HL653_20975 [Sphingomonas sp. AP4-R1]
MRIIFLGLATAALVASPAPAVRMRAKRPAAPALTVVTSGSEQALKLGETLLSRPFGADLIDSMTVIGRYGTAAEPLYVVEGTAGATCAARYVVVAARAGQPPVLSAPFGTCAKGISVRQGLHGLEMQLIPGTGTEPTLYAYANGAVRPLDARAEVADRIAPPQTLRCRNPGDMAGLDGDAFDAQLGETLPTAYRTDRAVRRAEIAPAALHEMVAGLACLAAWPGAGNAVFKAATPLFASKRYGTASFATLDRIAGATNSEAALRASARTLSAQMRYFVGKREPL